MNKPAVRQEISFIVWVRSISVFLILFCHLAQTHTNPYVIMSSQIFNVGVHIFIIISGFLFGYTGVKRPYGKWLGKRLKRIYIPYWLFLAVVLGLQFARGLKIDILYVCFSIVGMQRFKYVFPGSEHTWFITAILLCYFVTPFLDMVTEKLKQCPGKKWKYIPFCLLLAAPIAVAHLPDAAILQMCIFYSVAFILGKKWDLAAMNKTRALFCAGGIIFAFCFRFAARFLIDGTILYNNIVVSYTHFAAALCFFLAVSWCFNRKPWKIVSYISKVSFEVYLYHYMFIWPPLSVMSLTGSWIINCIVVVALSFVASAITNTALDAGIRFFAKKHTKDIPETKN